MTIYNTKSNQIHLIGSNCTLKVEKDRFGENYTIIAQTFSGDERAIASGTLEKCQDIISTCAAALNTDKNPENAYIKIY